VCNVGECVYVTTRLSDLQVELGVQTNVKRHGQLLHFNGRDVASFVRATDVVSAQLRTTEHQPLALLPTMNVGDGREHQPANIQRILRKFYTSSGAQFGTVAFTFASPVVSFPCGLPRP